MKKIGNNQIFIEFDENNPNGDLIPLRLCIGGEYLGTLDSPTYVVAFINSLKSLLTDDYYYSNSISDENYEIFFYPEGVVSDNYRITLEETFDDFSKRAARNNDTVYFTWFLYPDHFFEYKDNIPNKLVFSKCKTFDLLNLINNFCMELKQNNTH
ncbi:MULTISPECIES: hypothetical protein [Acinetobacter calcoaceticus/baumannii complex]|uniref:hypothetical protein n=1 Tax=Acinetobacter baumannii TaxID=470 RepID=UPI00294144BB|nr:hypothetical protein [Acinetobacter baumannii]MDV4223602.1 hypothetical protein [Acinetobacter baumannii]